MEEGTAGFETGETTSLAEVTRTLKEFLEKSPLGEFEARLGMLKSFHCQTIYHYNEVSNDGSPTQGRFI
jgi:hypothetical protein